MSRHFSFIAIFGLAMALTGCASIVKGTTQDVMIDTPGAAGAQCELSSAGIGQQTTVTPSTLTLKRRKQDVDIICRKPGFQDARATMASSMEPWTIGNILLGGVIGLSVDAGTGAWNKYHEPMHIPMQVDPAALAVSTTPSMIDPSQSLRTAAPQLSADTMMQPIPQEAAAPTAQPAPVQPMITPAPTAGSVLPMTR